LRDGHHGVHQAAELATVAVLADDLLLDLGCRRVLVRHDHVVEVTAVVEGLVEPIGRKARRPGPARGYDSTHAVSSLFVIDRAALARLQPTKRRAFPNIFIHGLKALLSPLVQLISTLRNTRSGCGM